MKYYLKVGYMYVREVDITSSYDRCNIEFTLIENKAKLFNTKIEALVYAKLINQLMKINMIPMDKEVKNVEEDS